ncbi:glycosyltransferase family 2 protein [Methylobacterium sp. 77]|uniref:glycosyltransferase family 2 protein n=1 Tax=Methylobacterium sp. 77 TaxID=1101192 RepID=UPI0003764F8A|nr:glycosyltransferase family 2 protein [Methylobacterium sp. 77]
MSVTETVAIIIATRGRPTLVRGLVMLLQGQSLAPDHIVIVGSEADDLGGIEDGPGLTARVGRIGSAHQRNDGLALAGGNYDYVAFFDDDFIPSHFWLEQMVATFRERPDVACLTGRVLADGAKSPGIARDEGLRVVRDEDGHGETPDDTLHEGIGPYGCNMAFRGSAIEGLSFDERLPLYAWLEDSDFGGQVARRGRTARADALWGVHLGNKMGRERGKRVGYSQVANSVYLMRKGTLTVPFLGKLMARNFAANVVRSLKPEPYIDRRGRLAGNIAALLDVARGRISPERTAKL